MSVLRNRYSGRATMNQSHTFLREEEDEDFKVLATRRSNKTNKMNLLGESSTRINRKSLSHGPLSHVGMLESILKTWYGEPEELFETKNWKKWIRRKARELKSADRFSADESVTEFANTLITLLLNDENHYYVNQVLDKMSDRQKKEFWRRKSKYDHDEDMKLLASARGGGDYSFSPSVEKPSQWSDDDDDFKPPLERFRSRTPSSDIYGSSVKCIEEKGVKNLLFQDPEDTIGYPTYPNGNRKSKKRNSTATKSERPKKAKSDVSKENFNQLPVKRNSLNGFSGNANKEQSDEDTLNLFNKTDETISNAFEQSTTADFYVENETPPCSPQCFNESSCVAVRSTTKATDSERCSSVSEKPERRRISIKPQSFYCSSKKSLAYVNGGSNSYSWNHKRHSQSQYTVDRSPTSQSQKPVSTVKRIKDYSRQQLSHQNNNDNALNATTVKDDEFELPDIEETATDQDKENYPVTDEEIIAKYPKPPSAPAMTLEMFEEIKNALEKPPKEKVVSGFSLNILQEELAIFNNDAEWLIDTNIDFYLELIRERSKQPGYPRVYIFHSFFYTLLSDKDGGYQAVKETTGDDDIFAFDLVFIPVHLNHHWRLVVYEFSQKRLRVYDSMRHTNFEVLEEMHKYLRLEYRRKHGVKQEELNGNNTKETEATAKENGCSYEDNTAAADAQGGNAAQSDATDTETDVAQPESAQSDATETGTDFGQSEATETEADVAQSETDVAQSKADVVQSEADVAQSKADVVQSEADVAQSEADVAQSEATGTELDVSVKSLRYDDLPFDEEYEILNVPSETIPQQKNAIDCGIFILQYAEYLSRKEEFDFDQSHVPYFRKRMMYETLTKNLLTSI